ncbi:MAG: DUF4199 domain-containing protein [Flavobacteriaceae bacterium]|nr:DUF4199 domain-containing protein [Flavobacteriaceae bacterium]
MENQVNSKSIILNNGLYLGLIGVLTGLILYATGNALTMQWVSNLVGFVATLVFIIVGINQFKGANGGFISWGQGVKVGMGIVMISAIITVIYTVLFTTVIEPDFQQQAMEFQKQAWSDAGMTQEQIDNATAMSEKFQTPVIVSAIILAFSAFVGFVISAIVAAIMKKSEESTY